VPRGQAPSSPFRVEFGRRSQRIHTVDYDSVKIFHTRDVEIRHVTIADSMRSSTRSGRRTESVRETRVSSGRRWYIPTARGGCDSRSVRELRQRTDILPRLKSWGSTVTDRAPTSGGSPLAPFGGVVGRASTAPDSDSGLHLPPRWRAYPYPRLGSTTDDTNRYTHFGCCRLHPTPEGVGFRLATVVNYPALLAPSRVTAIGHCSRAGLYRNDIVPRDPVRGGGRASSYRPAVGAGTSMMRPASSDDEDRPADLAPGVLTLYPKIGTE
jgi:hypothetical protein